MTERIAELESELAAVRARDHAEIKHRHGLKLQALGQMTAGVAHELNTPLQFVADNVHYLRDGVKGLLVMVEALRRVRDAARSGLVHPDFLLEADRAEAAADVDYLLPRVDRSFARALDGLGQITSIVDAMKRFSHPRNELAHVDVNASLETALIVSRNEYKQIAKVVVELGDLPPIFGHASDLGQVFFNLIINAAHAIVDRKDGKRGTITLHTEREGDYASITISDTGCGIPDDLHDRIFEPFFTTKEPGRGSGQGLTLVHAIVVEGHGGEIAVSSVVGEGTSVRVRLPVQGKR